MTDRNAPASPDPDRFTRRIDELRNALLGSDPNALAARTMTTYFPITVTSENAT